MDKVIIFHPESLQNKIKAITADGPDNLQIRSNFDGSLTLTYIDGKKIPSIIARLRQGGGYISDSYATAAQKLADTYRPFEYDQTIDLDTKRAKMLEWWTEHYKLLIASGMTKQVLDSLTQNEKANFRIGMTEFMQLTKNASIPIIIMSSSGIGNTIPMFLASEGYLTENIHVLTNELLFDKTGKMSGVKEPIIHTYNKNEISVELLPDYDQIKDRKNILLIGDTLGDLGMTEGFDYKELIKVGFLSEDTEKHLEEYKQNYDIVILDDGDMGPINDILKTIIGSAL